MAYNYPHLPTLWKFAWDPLKRVIEPIGLVVGNLLNTIPDILKELDNLKRYLNSPASYLTRLLI